MSTIHPSAVIAPDAQLGQDVEVGPFCVIGPRVIVGAGCRLLSHVNLDGRTTIGEGCTIFPFASVGTQTQDLKYKGGEPRVEIGAKTTIREYVTVNAATNDGDATKIGSGCHIMAYAHIAHDCIVGNSVIMANCATLAGHVIVEDEVGIGGLCGVHQFVRLGRLSYIGGCSKVTQDVPPFMIADGAPLGIHSINSVGMKRRGLSDDALTVVKKAYKILYREDLSTSQAVKKMEAELDPIPEVRALIDFVNASTRGITR